MSFLGGGLTSPHGELAMGTGHLDCSCLRAPGSVSLGKDLPEFQDGKSGAITKHGALLLLRSALAPHPVVCAPPTAGWHGQWSRTGLATTLLSWPCGPHGLPAEPLAQSKALHPRVGQGRRPP